MSLVHTKGGVAKTTSAVYLATAAYRRGLDVELIDADPQGSALEWATDAQGDNPLPFPVVPATRPLTVNSAAVGGGGEIDRAGGLGHPTLGVHQRQDRHNPKRYVVAQ